MYWGSQISRFEEKIRRRRLSVLRHFFPSITSTRVVARRYQAYPVTFTWSFEEENKCIRVQRGGSTSSLLHHQLLRWFSVGLSLIFHGHPSAASVLLQQRQQFGRDDGRRRTIAWWSMPIFSAAATTTNGDDALASLSSSCNVDDRVYFAFLLDFRSFCFHGSFSSSYTETSGETGGWDRSVPSATGTLSLKINFFAQRTIRKIVFIRLLRWPLMYLLFLERATR